MKSDVTALEMYRNGILVDVALTVRYRDQNIRRPMTDRKYLTQEIKFECRNYFDVRLLPFEIDAILDFLMGPHSTVPGCVPIDETELGYEMIEKEWHKQVLEYVKALNRLAYYKSKVAANE